MDSVNDDCLDSGLVSHCRMRRSGSEPAGSGRPWVSRARVRGPDDYVPPPPIVEAMPPLPRAFETGAALDNLAVFILPHSHDDTGWQRTVDEYVHTYSVAYLVCAPPFRSLLSSQSVDELVVLAMLLLLLLLLLMVMVRMAACT